MATKTSPGTGAQGGSEGGEAAVQNLEADTGTSNAGAVQNLGDDTVAPSGKTGGEGAGGEAAAAFDFKVPEGFDGDAFFEGFADFAKEQGFSSAQAQKFAERYAGQVNAAKEQVQAAHKERVAGWFAATKADKEIGGAKFEENWNLAKQGLSAVASDDFKQMLVETGLGSHPAMVRTLARIGRAIAEDSSAGTGGAAGEAKPKIETYDDLAKALGYTNS